MNYNELFLYARQLISCYKPKKKAAKDVIERLVMIHGSLGAIDGVQSKTLDLMIRRFLSRCLQQDADVLASAGVLNECFALVQTPEDLGSFFCLGPSSPKLITQLLELGAIINPGELPRHNSLTDIIQPFSASQVMALYENYKRNEWTLYGSLNVSLMMTSIVRTLVNKLPGKAAAKFLCEELSYLDNLMKSLGVDRFWRQFFEKVCMPEGVYANIAKMDAEVYEKIMSYSKGVIFYKFHHGCFDLTKIPHCNAFEKADLLGALQYKLSNFGITQQDLEGLETHFRKLKEGSILEAMPAKIWVEEARNKYISIVSVLNTRVANDVSIVSGWITPFFENKFVEQKHRVFNNDQGLSNYCVSLIKERSQRNENALANYLGDVIITKAFVASFVNNCVPINYRNRENSRQILGSILLNPESRKHLADIDAFKYRQILELFDERESFTKQADKACKDALRQVNWKDPEIKKSILNTDLSL